MLNTGSSRLHPVRCLKRPARPRALANSKGTPIERQPMGQSPRKKGGFGRSAENPPLVELLCTAHVKAKPAKGIKMKNDDAFETLMPRLRKRAQRLCRTPEEAEDLAQETALKLWQVLLGPDKIDQPEHYAMIMLHNLARQRWRARRDTEELAEDMAQTPPAAPARLACAEARAAIARLPEAQCDVMKHLLAGELSPQTIAKQSGVPLGTVMSRLARARARLRKDLDMDGSVADLL